MCRNAVLENAPAKPGACWSVSIDFQTVCEIDEAARSFDVLFDTGDEAIVRVPVALPAQ